MVNVKIAREVLLTYFSSYYDATHTSLSHNALQFSQPHHLKRTDASTVWGRPDLVIVALFYINFPWRMCFILELLLHSCLCIMLSCCPSPSSSLVFNFFFILSVKAQGNENWPKKKVQ